MRSAQAHPWRLLRKAGPFVVAAIILIVFVTPPARGDERSLVTAPDRTGATDVIVHGRLGGLIFGFEIDAFGTEGVLSEALINSDGTITAAIETFDQKTGRILHLVKRIDGQDDLVTLGVAGSIGLIERERVMGFQVRRSFELIDPLSGNKLTDTWKPGIGQQRIINQVKSSLDGTPTVAVYALSVSTSLPPVIFTSDLAANTFGPIIDITNPDFTVEGPPVLAFDPPRNQAILGHNKPSPFIVPPVIGFVDLTTGAFLEKTGLGLGVINGIAVDSGDGILCTDTSFDSGVQFFDLADFSGISVLLPGADPQTSTASGADIEFDPINKLFLVAQPFAEGMLDNGSAIQIYDPAGNLVETIDGLQFQGGNNVFPIHITVNPARRIGYVDGPELTTAIQQFSY